MIILMDENEIIEYPDTITVVGDSGCCSIGESTSSTVIYKDELIPPIWVEG